VLVTPYICFFKVICTLMVTLTAMLTRTLHEKPSMSPVRRRMGTRTWTRSLNYMPTVTLTGRIITRTPSPRSPLIRSRILTRTRFLMKIVKPKKRFENSSYGLSGSLSVVCRMGLFLCAAVPDCLLCVLFGNRMWT
jgi:hypothetical protein